MDELNTIGKRIRYARKVNNLSLTDVKEKTGISTGNLSELENDKFSPSSNTLIAFKRVYHVSIDWLLTGDPPKGLEEGMICESTPPHYLSNEERNLIEAYQTLNEERRRDIKGFINVVTTNSNEGNHKR